MVRKISISDSTCETGTEKSRGDLSVLCPIERLFHHRKRVNKLMSQREIRETREVINKMISVGI